MVTLGKKGRRSVEEREERLKLRGARLWTWLHAVW
jgi:hypothetical protein